MNIKRKTVVSSLGSYRANLQPDLSNAHAVYQSLHTQLSALVLPSPPLGIALLAVKLPQTLNVSLKVNHSGGAVFPVTPTHTLQASSPSSQTSHPHHAFVKHPPLSGLPTQDHIDHRSGFFLSLGQIASTFFAIEHSAYRECSCGYMCILTTSQSHAGY